MALNLGPLLNPANYSAPPGQNLNYMGKEMAPYDMSDSFMDTLAKVGVVGGGALMGAGMAGFGPLAGGVDMGLAGGGGAELASVGQTGASLTGDIAGAGTAATGAGAATFAGQPLSNTFASAAGTTDAPIAWDTPPAPAGGAADSIMNNPYAGGGNVGVPASQVDLSATGLGASSGVPTGLGGIGTGAGSLMGDAATGAAAGTAATESGSIFDTINTLLGPTGINGVSGAGILGAGMNYLAQGNAASQYGALAANAPKVGNALYDPQRQQAQGQLSTMLNNPSQYLKTDPFATSLADRYKNYVIPRNVAQSGNAANVIDSAGSQFVGALSADYGQKVGQLSGIAGFGFPPSGYGPSVAGAAGAGAIGSGVQQMAGLRNMFGQNQGTPAQGTSGTGMFGTVS